MAKTVNLDALIERQDFLSSEGPGAGESEKKSATDTDLRKGESFYSSLRKPDFQRETAAWSPDAVAEFVKSFIEGDLIPAVICWQSPSRLSFVIDGAHRLSAIIAWIQNDYGDKAASAKFYGGHIPLEQEKIAVKTRNLVNAAVGAYADLKAETASPGTFPHLGRNAAALAHAGIPLQWIKGPDSRKAERAFFKINQSAVRIDPTELKILNARTESNAIASRSIVRNATGHEYWKKFSTAGKEELVKTAKKIYGLLYNPPLDPPIRTSELPIAGHGYGSQTLPLIFDLVNIANGLPVKDPSKEQQKFQSEERPDPEEKQVLEYLRKTKQLARIFTGKDESSLGLLPAVYFYSANGRHQPTAVLSIAAVLMELGRHDGFKRFTLVRAKFEEFLLSHKYYVNQLTGKYGSMAKGLRPLKEYYELVLKALQDGKTVEQIEKLLNETDAYHFLVKERVVRTVKPKSFSGKATQLAFLAESLQNAGQCPLCGARKDNKAITADHIDDMKNGGLGTTENLQFLHPFCNSAKDALIALGINRR